MLRDCKCPMCGAINHNVDLEETEGWMECERCKAITCSGDEFAKHTVKVPLLKVKWMEE